MVETNDWDPAVLARFRADPFVAGFPGAIDETATTDELEHVATLIPDEWLAPAATGSPAAVRGSGARPVRPGCRRRHPARRVTGGARTGPRGNRSLSAIQRRAMTTDHERRDLADIEALSIEFWYRVDHQNGVGVADLFSEDGVYSVASGRTQAARRSPSRTCNAPRADRGSSRHVHTNLRLSFESPSAARGLSILTLWADDGEAPLDLKLPISVTDVEDEYVKESEGVWLIRHRHLSQCSSGIEPAVLPIGAAEATRAKGDDDALRHQ